MRTRILTVTAMSALTFTSMANASMGVRVCTPGGKLTPVHPLITSIRSTGATAILALVKQPRRSSHTHRHTGPAQVITVINTGQAAGTLATSNPSTARIKARAAPLSLAILTATTRASTITRPDTIIGTTVRCCRHTGTRFA